MRLQYVQRGISTIGAIGVIVALVLAFKTGSMMTERASMNHLDDLFEQVCDTSQRKTDYLLASSHKYYSCQYVRDMTDDEVARHKQSVDDAIGDGETKEAEKPKAPQPSPSDTAEK